MNESQLRELQKKELEILLEVNRICKKHHLTYYLIGGSALGARRHEGFIPWDDDVDIAMPRGDYRRFLALGAAELPDDYFLQTYRTQPDFPYPFSKVRLNNTTFIENRLRKLNIHHGIFIDVFPLDGAPRWKICQAIQARVVRFLRWAIMIRRLPFQLSTRITFWRCFAMELIMARFSTERSEKWGNISGGPQETMEQEVFGTPRLVEFEGHRLPVPHQLDRYLALIYGNDYLDLPPVEKRYGHDPLVVDINKSYVEYRSSSV